jgi:hypothetical protein
MLRRSSAQGRRLHLGDRRSGGKVNGQSSGTAGCSLSRGSTAEPALRDQPASARRPTSRATSYACDADARPEEVAITLVSPISMCRSNSPPRLMLEEPAVSVPFPRHHGGRLGRRGALANASVPLHGWSLRSAPRRPRCTPAHVAQAGSGRRHHARAAAGPPGQSATRRPRQAGWRPRSAGTSRSTVSARSHCGRVGAERR